MSKLHYSPLALCDLDDIWNYICEKLSNPTAALNIVTRIRRLRMTDRYGKALTFMSFKAIISA